MKSNYGTITRTRTFSEIFPDVNSFTLAVYGSGLHNAAFTTDSCDKLYYLLYASYGNSHIASSDENQFKYKVYTIIFNKGVQWQKSLEIQEKLSKLTEKDILSRGSNISSHAYNPGEGGIKVTDNEPILDYINDQSSVSSQADKVTAYMSYMNSLVDVTTDFINSFKPLFLKVVYPERPLWYVTDDDEEEEE